MEEIESKMDTLRKTSLQKINESLKLTGFSLRDFKIQLDPSSDKYISISFLPYSQYIFEIIEKDFAPRGGILLAMGNVQHKSDIGLATIESPGENKAKELTRYPSIDQCIQAIPRWGKRIGEELSAVVSVNEELLDFEQQFEKNLEDLVQSFSNNVGQPFLESEIQNVRSKLDSIFTKFEDLEKKHEITKQELETLREEFEKLKETLPRYPKGVWIQSTGHKLLDFCKSILKSKEGRDFILEAGKKMLE